MSRGLPFMSVDGAGPAWATRRAEAEFTMMAVVLHEGPWLLRPHTFEEPMSMTEDPRVQSFAVPSRWFGVPMDGSARRSGDGLGTAFRPVG